MAAVAVGAMSVAAQHADPQGIDGRRDHDTVPLAYTGMGGSAAALDVLPPPEITPTKRDTHAQDVASLGKAQHIADQRAEEAAAMVAAERKAAERKEAKAGRRGQLVPSGVVAPTTGVITSNFGPRWGTTHYGLDIANKIGTPVVSVMDGEVIDSGPASGFGLRPRGSMEPWLALRLILVI